MKIYIASLTEPAISPTILNNPKVDGITIRMYFMNFLMGNGFSEAGLTKLINYIKLIRDAGKQAKIGITFGAYCSTPFYNVHPHVLIVEKHHQGEGKPVPMKIPVFWDAWYLSKINDFLIWLKDGLMRDPTIYSTISYIDITGINQLTNEIRVPDQDFSDSSSYSYWKGTEIWLEAGYTQEKALNACKTLISTYAGIFLTKDINLIIIGGRNGFPCILGNKACDRNDRPDITKDVVENLKKFTGTLVQYCAFDMGRIPPPNWQISDRGILQLNKQVWDNRLRTKGEFTTVRDQAKSFKTEVLEIFENNVNLL